MRQQLPPQNAAAPAPSAAAGVARGELKANVPTSLARRSAYAAVAGGVAGGNYAGCYSVAARGDSISPFPKLLSLDSTRLAAAQGRFAVSALTTTGRRQIDSASWQPLGNGVRISFGRTPMDLRTAADSSLSATGMMLRRVDCPR